MERLGPALRNWYELLIGTALSFPDHVEIDDIAATCAAVLKASAPQHVSKVLEFAENLVASQTLSAWAYCLVASSRSYVHRQMGVVSESERVLSEAITRMKDSLADNRDRRCYQQLILSQAENVLQKPLDALPDPHGNTNRFQQALDLTLREEMGFDVDTGMTWEQIPELERLLYERKLKMSTRCYQALGLFSEASVLLERGANAQKGWAVNRLADVRIDLGQYEEAYALLTRHAILRPAISATHRLSVAIAEILTGRLEDAMATMAESHRLFERDPPQNPTNELHHVRLLIYGVASARARDDWKEVLQCAKKALNLIETYQSFSRYNFYRGLMKLTIGNALANLMNNDNLQNFASLANVEWRESQ
ncbi:hypothetical protein Tdes44962_MAKER03042 [Teratosphaeria destructans]|uniref:Uncharacterized protein n=1 Tax=Teratosphaeria destructans TaxID=418781 RepID=A0A9W7SRF1_9PEZI|nr:hypothetical protein Tdes44962_MAKER03042 [Teratosphaeria destructans]